VVEAGLFVMDLLVPHHTNAPTHFQQPHTAYPTHIFIMSKTTHTAPGFRTLTIIKPHPSSEAAQQTTTKIWLPASTTTSQQTAGQNTNLQTIRPVLGTHASHN
jgi:hypothetical protein